MIILAACVMIWVDDTYSVYPFLTFLCIVEAGVFVSYIYYHFLPFRTEYQYWKKRRDALIQINKRLKKIDPTGTQITSSLYLPKVKELRNELENESLIL